MFCQKNYIFRSRATSTWSFASPPWARSSGTGRWNSPASSAGARSTGSRYVQRRALFWTDDSGHSLVFYMGTTVQCTCTWRHFQAFSTKKQAFCSLLLVFSFFSSPFLSRPSIPLSQMPSSLFFFILLLTFLLLGIAPLPPPECLHILRLAVGD